MRDRLFALAGFFSFIVFLVIAIPLGLFFPGYNHAEDVISEQGAVGSPIMTQANVLFALMGVFFLIFAVYMLKFYARGREGMIAAVLLISAGLSITAVGFLPCDPGCADTTLTGKLHQAAAEAPLLLGALSLVLLAVQEYRHGGLGRAGKSNAWVYVFLIYLMLSTALAYFHTTSENYTGLIQRITIGTPMSIIAIASVQLYRTRFNKNS